MSKTHKFPVTVTVGSVSYRPGADVPVGGKNGISPEEVVSIEAVHGKWSSDVAPAREPAELADAIARADFEKTRADVAEARITSLETLLDASNSNFKTIENALVGAERKVKALESLIDATEELDAATVAAADKPDDPKLAEAVAAAEARWSAARAAAGR